MFINLVNFFFCSLQGTVYDRDKTPSCLQLGHLSTGPCPYYFLFIIIGLQANTDSSVGVHELVTDMRAIAFVLASTSKHLKIIPYRLCSTREYICFLSKNDVRIILLFDCLIENLLFLKSNNNLFIPTNLKNKYIIIFW